MAQLSEDGLVGHLEEAELCLGGGLGRGGRLRSHGQVHAVSLEPFEEPPRLVQNRAGNASEPGHVDAVAAIRAAGYYFAKEYDLVLPLAYCNVEAADS